MGDEMLRVYFSHHKAASSWTKIILFEIATALRLDARHVISSADMALNKRTLSAVAAQRPDLLMVNDQKPAVTDWLPPFTGLRIIRDPRDIIVSAYYSHRNSHSLDNDGEHWSDLETHRAELRGLDFDEGLLQEIEFSGSRFVDRLAEWCDDPRDVKVIKMEDLVARPLPVWTEILQHFGLVGSSRERAEWLTGLRLDWNLVGHPVGTSSTCYRTALARSLPRLRVERMPPEYLAKVVGRHSFQRLSGGRSPGQENPDHHYRIGVPGQWRQKFQHRHVAAFEHRFGDLAQRLGYQ